MNILEKMSQPMLCGDMSGYIAMQRTLSDMMRQCRISACSGQTAERGKYERGFVSANRKKC